MTEEIIKLEHYKGVSEKIGEIVDLIIDPLIRHCEIALTNKINKSISSDVEEYDKNQYYDDCMKLSFLHSSKKEITVF